MRAVLEFQRAVSRHELGAASSLRQSLVDLAAVSESLADDLRRHMEALSGHEKDTNASQQSGTERHIEPLG